MFILKNKKSKIKIKKTLKKKEMNYKKKPQHFLKKNKINREDQTIYMVLVWKVVKHIISFLQVNMIINIYTDRKKFGSFKVFFVKDSFN